MRMSYFHRALVATEGAPTPSAGKSVSHQVGFSCPHRAGRSALLLPMLATCRARRERNKRTSQFMLNSLVADNEQLTHPWTGEFPGCINDWLSQNHSWAIPFGVRTSLLLVALWAFVCQAQDTNELLSLRYLGRGPVNVQDYGLSGTIFWVTNHTTNRFVVTLTAIEVREGPHWITQTSLIEGLMFLPTNAVGARTRERRVAPHGDIDPHAEGLAYASRLSPNLPVGTIWRVRGNIQPMLTGWADTAARVRAYSGEVIEQLQGRTNRVPSKPGAFSERLTYYGSPVQIVGPEVVEQ